MIKYLPTHPLFGAFESFIEVVPQAILFKCAFYAFRPLDKQQEIHLYLIDDSLVVLTKEKFMEAINLRVLPSTKFYTPNTIDIFAALYQIGYQAKLKGITKFKKGKLPTVWQYVFHYIIRCLSGRTGGTDNTGNPLLDIVWSIFTENPVNYGNFL